MLILYQEKLSKIYVRPFQELLNRITNKLFARPLEVFLKNFDSMFCENTSRNNGKLWSYSIKFVK